MVYDATAASMWNALDPPKPPRSQMWAKEVTQMCSKQVLKMMLATKVLAGALLEHSAHHATLEHSAHPATLARDVYPPLTTPTRRELPSRTD